MVNLVSVVIPMRNEDKTIGDCLDALYLQKVKPREIIVIDNLSKDKSVIEVNKKINRFRAIGVPLKIFSCKKGNQTNARELGIIKSRGEIIGSLDADACPNEYWVEEIETNFKEDKVMAIGGRSTFRNRGLFFNALYFMRYHISLLGGFYVVGGGNGAFRRDAFFRIGKFRGLEELRRAKKLIYAQDDSFLSKKFERIGKILYCPKMRVTLLLRVRQNAGKYKSYSSILDDLKRVYNYSREHYIIIKFVKKLDIK